MLPLPALRTLLLGLVAGLSPLAADYPIVSHRYLADPAAMVHAGRVYIYCSNDDDNPEAGGYTMDSLVCVSSSDLKNWTDHGEVIRVPGAASWAVDTWAPAAIARNGKFYLYFANNASNIGVAVSDRPTGPFIDPLGRPLINAATPGVLPADNIWIFDPAVFIDDDGQAYLYFGGNGETNLRIIRLNEDMISVDGAAVAVTVPNFFEAAWLHRRDDLYYLSYSTLPSAGLRIDYLTARHPLGPFSYRGVLAAQPPENNNNNHAATFQLNGVWYEVYHNRVVSRAAGINPVYKRNLGVEALVHRADNTITPVTYTTDGVVPQRPLNPYVRVEAETTGGQAGIETEPCDEGGMNVTALEDGDWIRVRDVAFGSGGAGRFDARVASPGGGGSLTLRLDRPDGPVIGSLTVSATGGAQTWTTLTADVTGATGTRDLYFTVTGAGTSLFNFNWWQFTPATPPVITSPPRPLTLAAGQSGSLWVTSETATPVTYQWFHDGTPVAGATSDRIDLTNVSTADRGTYHVEVTNDIGTAVSAAAAVSLGSGPPAQLANLSVRAPLSGTDLLTTGFVLAGSAPRELLIRAVGPTLRPLGVTDAMDDPQLTLYTGTTVDVANDNWGDQANAAALTAASNARGAFPLLDASLDAAVLATFTLEPHTAVLASTSPDAGGIVLCELYAGDAATSRLTNLSARGDTRTGTGILTPGFVISGDQAMTVLIRAVGPALGNLGVPGRLDNPILSLFSGDTVILRNDDWGDATNAGGIASAAAAVGAFALPSGGRDAAMLVTLMPGLYTAQAIGLGETTGNVLVEVYEVP